MSYNEKTQSIASPAYSESSSFVFLPTRLSEYK